MKNGFTLVELLAVIVILAVLALIATPVVLSIIDDAKESAMLRSAEMYLSGVENAVMRENMNSGGNFRPNECTISSEGNLDCEGKEGIIEVEVNGEKPKNGNIIFENGKIKEVTLTYESGTIEKNEEGNLVFSDEENNLRAISLNNWEHQLANNTVENHIDENSDGICDICGETEIPGLYRTDGTFISWEKLLNDGLLFVENNQLKSNSDGSNVDENLKTQLNGLLIVNNTVESIRYYTFNGCINLKSIKLPDSIKTFGAGMFAGCTGLESVLLPTNSASELVFDMFHTCTSLKTIDIPKSITSIGYSFANCTSLEKINYEGTMEEWNSIEKMQSPAWNWNCNKIIVHCSDGEITIPAYAN